MYTEGTVLTISHAPDIDHSSQTARLQIQTLSTLEGKSIAGQSDREESDREEVMSALSQSQKWLPAKYLYDDRGSQLFEQICDLPEYYPTRTEAWILQRYAKDIAEMTGPCELVELGSGSSTKTRRLLDAYQALGGGLRYVPIDVSGTILIDSAKQLLADYPALRVQGLVGTYEQALVSLKPTTLAARMLFFLGSSLGNMDPDTCHQFFAKIFDALETGDYFLLGIDLQKPKDILEPAYDDAQGVTAAFNLNLLSHLNWRFEGDFNLANFEHWAFYNEQKHQIEMHLRSLTAQTVSLSGQDIAFERGETIHTEISRKFNLEGVQQDLKQHGLVPLKVWTDVNQWFGLVLTRKG